MGKKLKLLFLNADSGDYLNISLLHGLKTLNNIEVIDYPKSEVSYIENREMLKKHLRGNGFTLFFNLPDNPVKRFHIKYEELPRNEFDLIVLGDIQSNFGLYLELLPHLKFSNTAILDGSDNANLFGDSGVGWRHHY